MGKAVAYVRVSTVEQGRSGLGLDAQRAAVRSIAAQRGLTLLAEFTEVESGKRNDRPELIKALHHAKITGAVLVIAKLDRLSRNAAFLLTLRDSGVRFLAADIPDANDLTIGVLAVVAQRYEHGSTIVTSNLPFEEWTSVLGSERLTGALLDRLTHHVHILTMNGDSYRLAQSTARRRLSAKANQTADAHQIDPDTGEILPA
jgi:hypothetical protein